MLPPLAPLYTRWPPGLDLLLVLRGALCEILTRLVERDVSGSTNTLQNHCPESLRLSGVGRYSGTYK